MSPQGGLTVVDTVSHVVHSTWVLILLGLPPQVSCAEASEWNPFQGIENDSRPGSMTETNCGGNSNRGRGEGAPTALQGTVSGLIESIRQDSCNNSSRRVGGENACVRGASAAVAASIVWDVQPHHYHHHQDTPRAPPSLDSVLSADSIPPVEIVPPVIDIGPSKSAPPCNNAPSTASDPWLPWKTVADFQAAPDQVPAR